MGVFCRLFPSLFHPSPSGFVGIMRSAMLIMFFASVARAEDTTDGVDNLFERSIDRTSETLPVHSDLDQAIRLKKKKCNTTLVEKFGCDDKVSPKKTCGLVSGACPAPQRCVNNFGIGFCHCKEGECNYAGECKPANFCLDGLPDKDLKKADEDLKAAKKPEKEEKALF